MHDSTVHLKESPGSTFLPDNSLPGRRRRFSQTMAVTGCAVMWCASPLAQPPTPMMRTTNADDMAAGPETPQGDWKKDLMDPRVAVREAVLRKVAPAKLIPYLEGQRERILQDESARLRLALAGSTRDAGTLERLARDADADVRRAALENLMVPASVLLAEAERLAKAPASRWNTSDPDYMDHMSAVQELLKHPRLPAQALRVIHRAYPRLYRLEPHRNMPLLVALERAQDDTPSLEFEAEFSSWKRVAQDAKGDHAAVFAAMLSSEDDYLKSAARMNAATPVAALMAHVRQLGDDTYALEDVAKNALLGAANGEGAELRQRLMCLKDSGVDEVLARNPDLPVEALRELGERVPQSAKITLWQAWGVVGE